MIENDSYLLDKMVKEECINHRFAHYLENLINQELLKNDKSLSTYNLSVDVEYNKYWDYGKYVEWIEKPIRPDIVLHERWPNKPCILAIEIKKKYISTHDKAKIKWLISDDRFKYRFWVCVSKLISPWKRKIEIFWENDPIETIII